MDKIVTIACDTLNGCFKGDFLDFIRRQFMQIREGGWTVLRRKILELLLTVPALVLIIIVRVLAPVVLIRFENLMSTRIGHFALNTELYVCNRDAGINIPNQRHLDIFFMILPICNQQLARMWSRTLLIWPHWAWGSISRVNRLIPGGKIHEVGDNIRSTRDVNNLLDRFPPHLEFSEEEERQGQAGLRSLGVPLGADYICFFSRDSAYLDGVLLRPASTTGTWGYHDYRDSSIHKIIPAADELTRRDYFAIRMGAIVKEPITTANPRIIDYATTDSTDFLDIYLGANCYFALGGPSGYTSIPEVFRRPQVWINMIPLGHATTWGRNDLMIPKKLWLREESRFLTFREIHELGIGDFLRSEQYTAQGIDLVENTPEEIIAVTVEMDERLKNNWHTTKEDEEMQLCFWSYFKSNDLHGTILSRIGAEFLRQNTDLL